MGELVRFIPRQVNGVIVDQRVADGFINATAMCKAHGKDISNWLKTDDTWDLVVALAEDLSVSPNPSKKTNSDKTRVAAIYPSLVLVKRGSPANGGGVWIHPDLATDLGAWCNKRFAIQVARWIREWFVTGKNPIGADFDIEQQYKDWQERYDIRIELKDHLRPELMEATRAYAVLNNLSPITLCWRVHDAMNERIQGAKAKDIRTFNGLPLSVLLRDYFDTKPLHIYAAINRIATNRILDANINPIQAIGEACDMYLGAKYIPKLVSKMENLYMAGRRIRKAKMLNAISNHTQLSLFPGDQAI